jgi:hypothetical protein
MMINATIFSNYHRFGSSSTILFDEAAGADDSSGGEIRGSEDAKGKKSSVGSTARIQSNNR